MSTIIDYRPQHGALHLDHRVTLVDSRGGDRHRPPEQKASGTDAGPKDGFSIPVPGVARAGQE